MRGLYPGLSPARHLGTGIAQWGGDFRLEGLKRPYFEIDSRNASFMGSASCNQMRGSLFFEPGLLRFDDIRTTRKMCPGGLEAEFLKTLQSTIHYKIEDGQAYPDQSQRGRTGLSKSGLKPPGFAQQQGLSPFKLV